MKSNFDSKTVAALSSKEAVSEAEMKRNKTATLTQQAKGSPKPSKSFKEQIEERYEQVLSRKLEIDPVLTMISEPIETPQDNQGQELPDYIKEIGFTIADFAMPSREQIASKVKYAQEKMSTEEREVIHGKYAPTFHVPLPRGGAPLPKPKKG